MFVLFVACTGEDAVLTPDDGAAPTESGTPDSNLGDASGATDGGPDALSDAEPSIDAAGCPPLFDAASCGASPDATVYGTPALHLDTCAIGDGVPQQHVTTWTAKTGQVLQPLPTSGTAGGALFCRAGLNGRPAMLFQTDGFTLPVGATARLDDAGSNTNFIIVAVMRYSKNGPAGAAGGIVFQRVQQTAPFFPGPQLAATFAYALTPATTNLTSTDLFGTSVRFGTNDPLNTNDAGSLSVVTSTSLADQPPFIAYARRDGSTLSLTINAVPQGTVDLPPEGTSGQGLAVNIGGTGSSNNCLRGAIGELLYYVGDTKPNEGALFSALRTKWGIP